MLLFLIILVILILDQWTKYLISSRLTFDKQIPVIKDFFNIVYVRNNGAAFGLFSRHPTSFTVPFFIIVSILAIGMVIYFYKTYAKGFILRKLALAFILGGAIGNLIDRVRFGSVVDFLDFYWKTRHWPAFNVADTAICIGVGLLILEMIKDEFCITSEKPKLE
ncbi:MAG: signal peptidase II [bacterium]